MCYFVNFVYLPPHWHVFLRLHIFFFHAIFVCPSHTSYTWIGNYGLILKCPPQTHVLNDCFAVDRSIWRGIVGLLGYGTARRRQSAEGAGEAMRCLAPFSTLYFLIHVTTIPGPMTINSAAHAFTTTMGGLKPSGSTRWDAPFLPSAASCLVLQ